MSSTPYTIAVSQVVVQHVRVLTLRAVRKGLLDPLLASLQATNDRLVNDPIDWGDPVFRYTTFGWHLYQRAITPLYVSYGVDDIQKIVYLRSIQPFPGGGLESVP